MHDRSSRPHRSPRQTPAAVEERVVRLRCEHRIGPGRLAARTGIAASTAHRILRRHSLPALAALDRATGEPVRRHERARPGELVHIDVKKLGRIPDGGGHRVLGRAAGSPNKDRRNGAGYAFLHTALDDHSRLAYTEDLPDETAATCAGFLYRAVTWFAARGVTVERVLTDNAWAYTKNTWRDTCRDLGISPRWTRPWRPQTNGKVERFHRTLLDEWAYQQPYTSDAERQAAFPDWLDWYNYHRPHTGISGHTPASRVTNLSDQHT
jgi:transposase InsO family protein